MTDTSPWYPGDDAVLYYAAAGTTTVGSMTAVGRITNLSTSDSRAMFDVTPRGSAIRKEAPGKRTVQLSFTLLWEPNNAAHQAIRAAYLNGTLIALCPLTGANDVVGSEGPVGDWTINQFPLSQPPDEAQTIEVTASLFTSAGWHQVEA